MLSIDDDDDGQLPIISSSGAVGTGELKTGKSLNTNFRDMLIFPSFILLHNYSETDSVTG